MNNIIDIEIFGKRYSFKVDSNNSEIHIKRAVDFFISEVYEIDKNIDGQVNATKLVKVLLALMNITKKSLETQRSVKNISKISSKFLTEIETGLNNV